MASNRSRATRLVLAALMLLALVPAPTAAAWNTGNFTPTTGAIYFLSSPPATLKVPVTYTVYSFEGGAWVATDTVTTASAKESRILKSGPYRIQVTDATGTYQEGWLADPGSYGGPRIVGTVEEATDIVVPGGQWARVPLRLPGSAVVSGRLVDSVTGAPISGMYVDAVAPGGQMPELPYGRYISAADGTFSLRMTPGEYRLLVWSWNMPSSYVVMYLGEPETPGGTPFVLAANESRVGQDYPVQPAGVVSGRVMREDGLPAVGASIKVVQPKGANGLTPGYATGTTDADGYFNAKGIGAGPSTITVTGAGDDFGAVATATVSAAATTTIPDITVKVGGRITGNASLLPTDYPRTTSITIELYKKNDDGSFTKVNTDSRPGFTFPRLLPGTYRLGFAPSDAKSVYWPDSPTLEGAQDIVVESGKTVTCNVDIYRFGCLSGSVFSSVEGAAPWGSTVTIWEQQSDGSWVQTATAGLSQYAYGIRRPFDGTYRVTAADPKGYYGPPDVNKAADVAIGRSKFVKHDVTMTPDWASVEVSVTSGSDGSALDGAEVDLYRYQEGSYQFILERWDYAGEDGVVRFADVMPGLYRVSAHDALHQLHQSQTFEVTAHGGEDVRTGVALERLGVFFGTVRTQGTSLPVPGALVLTWSPWEDSYDIAIADELGRYMTTGLLPGDWWADVSDPTGRYVMGYDPEPVLQSWGAVIERSFEMTRAAVTTTRVSAKTKPALSAGVSAATWDTASEVVLATDASFADALAGAPLAYALDGPIMLTGRDSMPASVTAEITRLAPDHITVLGGEASVGTGVIKQLGAMGYGASKVTRIGGKTRYDTARNIALALKSALSYPGTPGDPTDPAEPYVPYRAFVVSGENFPDALSVSSLAAAEGSPILLTQASVLPAETTAALGSLGTTHTVVVGGTASVSKGVYAKLPSPMRLSGTNRYDANRAVVAFALAEGFDPTAMVVASGLDYRDAMIGGSAAAPRDGVLVLTGPTYARETSAAVAAVAPGLVDVLYVGDLAAVPAAVEAKITAAVRALAR